MQFIAHRGLWQRAEERNSHLALKRAFEAGFGVETDIRDCAGELVISHDMPHKGALLLAAVLDDFMRAGQPGVLALNIKSDGLVDVLKQQLKQFGVTRYFCFDMSVPDSLHYFRADMVTAARVSEYEPEGKLADKAPVLWVDGFHGCQASPERLSGWLEKGKQICLVSPELHRRDTDEMWEMLQQLPENVRQHPNLMLCTDYPLRARERLA